VTTVVIPWRPTDDHRTRALAFVEDHYLAHHPEWPVVVAECPDGPWSKARALIPAVQRLDPLETVVVADADVITDPDTLTETARVVDKGTAWAIPHQLVHRLSADSTALVLAGADPHGLPLSDDNKKDRKPYQGIECGGIVAMRAGLLLDVPPDVRFEGWGHEDIAWSVALHRIEGPPARLAADLFHLWHPSQPRIDRAVGSQASRALCGRYRKARTPESMRALLDESRAMWGADATHP
jgi:hypothetical protein